MDASVGSVGDSYDNALAETINGLYKTEVIRRRGPWKNIEEVEYATLEWVDWVNPPLPPLEKFLTISNSYDILSRRVALQPRV